MAVLGEISYPLYAINQPLVRWLSLVANSPFIARFGINPYVDLFARLLLMCGLALVISRFYDLPVRAALRRLVATRPNSKKAAAMP
jgi:peptidoglycan/LPS O-acetylase OafA/YrhL